VIKMINILED